ncbi:MAG: nitroreductase family protein, partial [Bifidobacterium sp.]|nr:nitroreductase family protein [Bifidobacterium sp.]
MTDLIKTDLATNDFTKILEGRRSIRKYDSKVKISREEMLAMLDEAAKAPS